MNPHYPDDCQNPEFDPVKTQTQPATKPAHTPSAFPFSEKQLDAANTGQECEAQLIASKIFGHQSRYRAELMRSRFGSAVFFIFDAYKPHVNGPLKGMPDVIYQTSNCGYFSDKYKQLNAQSDETN